jgi:hypothetical protein
VVDGGAVVVVVWSKRVAIEIFCTTRLPLKLTRHT